ncbi:FAD-binding oxidoreductase [Donghicola tyrosinivorans]|uniref:FAD-binding FR-type domain-containing protein n=1 Tax=Donghicola tyrosinivorans TaxID=1652492 RepID=A0A2T0X0J6_9RHOB|nr:FAD-binding oxidoreductase [Donghicola tyrosinivorans]PRY92461.1 hypothetical protein CLV74_102376 [Donghicola tyrosinivorans]
MSTTLTLQTIEKVTHDTHHLVFARPEGFDITPGQAVDLTLQREGWQDEARPFTPVNTEGEDTVEFVIKSYPSHHGVTEQIADLKEGEKVDISEPWGAIHDEGPGTFIAGGAGITPFIAILRQRLEDKGTLGGATLIFSNKTEKDIILRDEFEDMPGLKTVFTVTDQDIASAGVQTAMIDKEFLAPYATSKHAPFYLCGPDKMVEELEQDLKDLGVPEDAIIREDFS